MRRSPGKQHDAHLPSMRFEAIELQYLKRGLAILRTMLLVNTQPLKNLDLAAMTLQQVEKKIEHMLHNVDGSITFSANEVHLLYASLQLYITELCFTPHKEREIATTCLKMCRDLESVLP